MYVLKPKTKDHWLHPSARGDDVFWYRLPVNINRPLSQLKKSLCSVFFG